MNINQSQPGMRRVVYVRQTEPKKDKKESKYEMGGPPGVVFFLVIVISLTYFVTQKCQSGKWNIMSMPSIPRNVSSYLNWNMSMYVLLWLLLQVGLYMVPVGEIMEAPPLINGSGLRLKYRLNGMFALAVNIIIMAVLTWLGWPLTVINKHLLHMLTFTFLTLMLLSVVLYVKATKADKSMLNPKGQSGNAFYDWFMGREISARFGFLDVKFVLFRSAIIAYTLLDLVNLLRNIETNGGQVNPSLLVVFLMHLCYCVDNLWFEDGLVVSRDIVWEGTGANILLQMMMIPFTFIVQTRYLATTNFTLKSRGLILVTIQFILGYWIFRGSNSQKNNYRRNPNDPKLAHLKTMKTERGTNLLISGWWGMCRHPNYLGDIIISFASAFPTGFNHFLPFLNPLFLVFMLLDRADKDNMACRQKYDKDWDKYCQHVKYKILPWVY